MKIEILLTELSRKTDVMTHLARDPELEAAGTEVRLPGLKLELGERYMYFTITRWARAEDLLPLFFSVQPAGSAYTFRPQGDLKMLVTCRSKPIPDIIPSLTAVEHLDMEAGELSGAFEVAWHAHDVAVIARGLLMIQGRLAAAKVKFAPQARDTEYHCRACIDLISCRDVLAVFCDEDLTQPILPVIGPVTVEGTASVPGDGWSAFFNAGSWSAVTYDRKTGELRASPGPGGTIGFRLEKDKNVGVWLRLTDPALLTDALAADAATLLGMQELRMRRKVSQAVLDLDRLTKELGFGAARTPGQFVREGEFAAAYDAQGLTLTMEAALPLTGPSVHDKATRLARVMEVFTAEVMARAV